MVPRLKTGVVITMAGMGTRFAEAGYTKPKYEIEVHRKTLFAWSMDSLRSFIEAGCPFTFVARNLPRVDSFIHEQCKQLDISHYTLLLLDSITNGQATTAMLARSIWDDPNRPVAIYNIDTYVNPEALPLASVRGNGWVPCFPGDGDKWSFAAADDSGRIREIREKKRISPHASIGLYWFDSFARYIRAYEEYYADSGRIEARERYIAPLYNQLIAEGEKVYLHKVGAQDVYPLGTPEDVGVFSTRSRPDLTRAVIGQ